MTVYGIDVTISSINSNPFIFIAYSHGNEKALCCGNENYIEKGVNAHNFGKSLFYTNACLVGKELGIHLIEQGCLAFVGYEKESYKYTQPDKKEISKNCDNAGIISFLSDDITIFEAYNQMKNYYTQQINKLEDFKDMVFAGDQDKTYSSLYRAVASAVPE